VLIQTPPLLCLVCLLWGFLISIPLFFWKRPFTGGPPPCACARSTFGRKLDTIIFRRDPPWILFHRQGTPPWPATFCHFMWRDRRVHVHKGTPPL